jgi:hypothetical protein
LYYGKIGFVRIVSQPPEWELSEPRRVVLKQPGGYFLNLCH